MYAVIFRATAGQQDQDYSDMVARLRELAFARYNCQEFFAVTEGDQEVAISYWNSEADIRAWRKDSEHELAQHKGRARWYSSYRVEVVEIRRQYRFDADSAD